MFIGHYAPAFLIKARAKDIPLWCLFLVVQIPDIIWSILVLTGVEKVLYQESSNVYLQAEYKFFPFSHSLLANLLFVILLYVMVKRFKDGVWAFYLALAFISHWLLDLVVHTKDLPLVFDSMKVGFSLWNYPYASLRTEVIILGLSAALYLWVNDKKQSVKNRTTIFLLLIWLLFIFNFFASAIPPTPIQAALTSLLLYATIPLAAWWIERSPGRETD